MLGLVVLLLLSVRAIAGLYTDYLWFDALDFSAVWQRKLGMQAVLVVVFTTAFFALCYLSLALSDRFAPQVRTVGPADEAFERFRELIEPRQTLVRVGVSLALALAAGIGAASQWQNWLLFRYGKSFGTEDPLLGTDVSFYMFKLPFLSYVASWAFASLIVVLLVTVMNMYANGSIRLPSAGRFTVPGSVKVHLSALAAALALVKAGDYYLDRFRLTLSADGVVDGALYSAVEARLPALSLLVAISIFCAVLFLVNTRQKGWGLPVVSVALWVLVSLVVGTAYPLLIQRFRVQPEESALEAPYIEDNIEATRAAMGLGDVHDYGFDYSVDITDEEVTANGSTVGNIRLLDPSVVGPTFSTLEGKLDFYGFDDLDIDRYEIDGQTTQVVLGARELNAAGLPRDTWESKHLTYTNGYGVALAPANAVNSSGRPDFLVGDVPLRVESGYQEVFDIEHPEIYFGEPIDDDSTTNYAILDTNIDQDPNADADPDATTEDRYVGEGGVPINSFVRKAAFALRFGDIEPLISDYLTDESKIVYIRDVSERVSEVAPFLTWDSDPYPVIADGRISYVIDGYATSSYYPYAQQALVGDLESDADLRQETFNYLRNSVKAVVDAYDGTVNLYLTDELYGETDPVIRTYAAAFPELFSPLEDMSSEIREHLRYPEDMFRVQTAMWGRYHLSDSRDFYNQDDRWDVAQRPPDQLDKTSSTAITTAAGNQRIDPFYLQMRLPEEDADEFLIFRPFVPYSAPNSDSPKRQLNAFMVGRSDPEHYGSLQVYTMTTATEEGDTERNRQVDGPLNVHEKMVSETDGQVSQELTLLNSSGGGSNVQFGDMVIVPIENSLLYVRPLFVSGESEASPPELRKVLVYSGDQVEIGDTLSEAVLKLFPDARVQTREAGSTGEQSSDDPDAPDDPGTSDTPTSDDDAAVLLTEAMALFGEADEALKEGGTEGLVTYQEKTAEATEKVAAAAELLNAAVNS